MSFFFWLLNVTTNSTKPNKILLQPETKPKDGYFIISISSVFSIGQVLLSKYKWLGHESITWTKISQTHQQTQISKQHPQNEFKNECSAVDLQTHDKIHCSDSKIQPHKEEDLRFSALKHKTPTSHSSTSKHKSKQVYKQHVSMRIRVCVCIHKRIEFYCLPIKRRPLKCEE